LRRRRLIAWFGCLRGTGAGSKAKHGQEQAAPVMVLVHLTFWQVAAGAPREIGGSL
jgi:hypothetical protein